MTEQATSEEPGLSARDVLSDDPAALLDLLQAAIAELDDAEELPADATAGTTRAVRGQAAAAIDHLLGELGLDDVLMGGWMKLSDLNAAIEDTAADGSTRHVALKQHTITSDHEPTLELVVNRVSRPFVRLGIHLQFEIAACELVISAGRIAQIEVGSLVAAGSLSIAGRSVLEHETDRLDPKRLFPSEAAPPEDGR